MSARGVRSEKWERAVGEMMAGAGQGRDMVLVPFVAAPISATFVQLNETTRVNEAIEVISCNPLYVVDCK